MALSISSSVIACLKSYNELVEEIKQDRMASPRGLVAGSWEDELGRLRMWAANIGAHQTGQSSLDFRLRDASHVREQIMHLLQGLLQRLQKVRDALAHDEESDNEEPTDDPLDEDEPKTEIPELQESLATNINCLFQMSMLVRRPVLHDVYQGSKQSDVAVYEPWDYHHVRDKFSKADDTLVERLGNAITRRRKYLKYRERHAAKLRQGISEVDPGARDLLDIQGCGASSSGIKSILSDTVATDFQHQHIDFDNSTSDTEGSQTSYAPTLVSEGNVTIPAPPKDSSDGAPFEYPYCFYVITVDGRRSWNKHVFQDLKPYVCMATSCTTPGKLYSTRHEWLHHSNVAHPDMMMDDGATENTKGLVICPLCKEKLDSKKPYERHLARHLQEIALFILPCGENDSDMGEDEASESSSNAEIEHLTAPQEMLEMPEDLPAPQSEDTATFKALGSSSTKRESEAEEKGIVITWKDVQESLTNMERETEEEQRLLGTEQSDTLTVQTNLGRNYFDQGRLEEAETLTEELLKARTRALGSEHPNTLIYKSGLALIYREQGRLEEAIALIEQVLAMRIKVLGIEHPDTLTSNIGAAKLYAHVGRFAEATTLTKQVLETKIKVLGAAHPRTLESTRDLAELYEKQQQLVEAESMYHRAWRDSQRAFSHNHFATIDTINQLGNFYQRQNRLVEAEKLYLQALDGLKKALGTNDPKIISTVSATVNALVHIYLQQSRLVEAEEMLQFKRTFSSQKLGHDQEKTETKSTG